MSLLFNKVLLAISFVASLLLLLSILTTSATTSSNKISAAQPASAWKGRRIYQLMTDRFAYPANASANNYCQSNCNMNVYLGGTFQGIIDHLDYITGMGFNAIWISPIPKQFEGKFQGMYEAYHGYWSVLWTDDPSNVNPHFGTPADLQALVAACHAKGVWVMIDMVLNHAGPIGDDYSLVQPFNQSEHYHPDCDVNTYECNNENTLLCRLAGLADLNQQNPFVTSTLMNYVKYLTRIFDGIRADTVMYINEQFWQEAMGVANTLITGEVFSSWSCQTTYVNAGSITSSLNYKLFSVLRNVFLQQGSMQQLGAQWRQVKALPNPHLETLFVDNHDNTRWLSLPGATVANFYSANSHVMFQLGIPIVYQGTEQLYTGNAEDNTNREPLWTSGFNTNAPMYQWLARANAAYDQFNLVNWSPAELWMDESVYCFSRGPVLHCVSNTEGTAQTRSIPNLPFSVGQTICDWLTPSNPCQQGDSQMDITIPASGMPILLYAK
jgi:alpha-amylase